MLKELFEAVFKKTEFDPKKAEIQYDELNQPLLVLPDHLSVHSLDGYLNKPTRTAANKEIITVDGFIQYFNRFKLENTYTFVRPDFEPVRSVDFMRVVFDYHHSDGTPDWCGHAATLSLRTTPEFQLWDDKEGERMSLRDFINFVKDNATEITKPNLAELLDALKKITINANASTSEGVSGHNEERSANAKVNIKGAPDQIELALPIFVQSDRYKIVARLNIFAENDGVRVSYELSNIKQALNAEYKAIIAKVAEQCDVEIAY